MKVFLRPRYHRIQRILQLIREGTRSGRYPNAATFCRELEVSRWTVLRDLDWLRDEERAPIEYVPASHGYRLGDPTWELPPISVAAGALFAFAVARRLIEGFRGTPLEADMRSVLDRIGRSLEGSVTVDLEGLTDRLSVVADDYVRQDPGVWQRRCGRG